MSKLIKPMANTNQPLSIGDVANSIIETTGKLAAKRKLIAPDPSDASDSYQRTIHHAGTVFPIVVTTVTGDRTIEIPPGCTSIVEFDENGVREITGKVYDPRDYGCPWDGIHDDLPGLDAMMSEMTLVTNDATARIQLPRGTGYCSDTWRITRPVIIEGHGWGLNDVIVGTTNSGIRFPTLKAGIQADYLFTKLVTPGFGASAACSTFTNFNIRSTQGVVTNGAVGGAGRALQMLDSSLDRRAACTYYEKGTCVLADAQATSYGFPYFCDGATRTGPVVMFRVTTAGTSAVGATPAAFATRTLAHLGTTIPDGTVTWTVESIPKDYLNSTAYVVGQRVFLPGDPTCYFECVEAGTSMAAGALDNHGIGVKCNSAMVTPAFEYSFYDDGGVGPGLKWRTYMPHGLLILAPNCTIRNCGIGGFTGAGLYATSKTAPDVHSGAGASGNFTTMVGGAISHCGMGIKFEGRDTNGCLVDQVNTLYLGLGRSNVDGPTFFNLADPEESPNPLFTWGTGAAAAWDHATGSNAFRHLYGQFSAGPPFRNDLSGISGTQSYWSSCFAETAGHRNYFVGYPVVVQCTPMSETGGGIIIGPVGRGITEQDNSNLSSILTARITDGGGSLHTLNATDDVGNIWGWKYSAGYWSFVYSGQNGATAFSLSSSGAGSTVGTGWVSFDRGYFAGTLFRGAVAELIDRNLKSGSRSVGDQFTNGKITTTVTTAGYRGERWSGSIIKISEGYEPWAIPGYVVEPSTNGPEPVAGLSVWQFILHIKDPSRLATAAALPMVTASGSGVGKTLTATATGTLTVDGVLTALNDRILVKDQVTASDNGIYQVTTAGAVGVAFVLTRATDADQDAEVTAGLATSIAEGTVNAGTTQVLITNNPIVVDTTSLTFTTRLPNSSAVEPVWSTATPGGGTLVGDVITESGGVVWELVGFTPAVSDSALGQYTIPMENMNQTLNRVNSAPSLIKATGDLTTDKTLTFPAPDNDTNSYQKTIRNQCTGSNLIISTGKGTIVTMTPGLNAILAFDASGVDRAVTGV